MWKTKCKKNVNRKIRDKRVRIRKGGEGEFENNKKKQKKKYEIGYQ